MQLLLRFRRHQERETVETEGRISPYQVVSLQTRVRSNAMKYRTYSRNSRTFLTKILYLNLGCVIYARKRFYVNKSGYTGNFFKHCIKSVNYAS